GGEGISTKDLVAMVTRIAGSNIPPDYIADDGRVRLPTGAGLHFVNTKAREVLGWAPEMPLEDGIRRLIADHEARKPDG
ncbi:MAG: epimerase, partial [Pseudomonadota bacterium]